QPGRADEDGLVETWALDRHGGPPFGLMAPTLSAGARMTRQSRAERRILRGMPGSRQRAPLRRWSGRVAPEGDSPQAATQRRRRGDSPRAATLLGVRQRRL